MTDCNHDLIEAGKAHPRTCRRCGLGPCQSHPLRSAPVEQTGRENVISPMGFYYRVDKTPAGNPYVYRCKLGQAWERMEIYDIGELSSEELRFIADVIDASKSEAA